ncbi:MAG: UbiA family prenyltransferase [Clostridiales bacterium]|nr:UbiA family prenyltransferase [Clostridiales bacterium]
MVKRFLSYVEIKTKITSIFPFLMTLAYLYYNGKDIHPLRTAVFFCGMLLFDLTATTINNYEDTKKNRQTLQFNRRTAFYITAVLFLFSAVLGIYLVSLTDIVVLLLGGLCFLFGVLYSWGPLPLSHSPLGEAASGFFYGFVIPLILYYINAPKALFTYSVSMERISADINVSPAVGFLLLSVMPFCLTAGVMLANNICDLERDVKVRRYTLAYYLKRRAVYVFALLYYTAYASVIVMVIAGFLSPLSLLVLITLIPVQKNITVFMKKQVKEETFTVSIQNFILMMSVHIILIVAGRLL